MQRQPFSILQFFCLFTLLSTTTFDVYAQNQAPWQTWKKNKTITILTRTSEHQSLPEIKATLVVNSTLSGFISFISDYEHLPNWLFNAQSAALLKQVSPQENIFITKFQSIWPVKPREMVIHSVIKQNDDYSLEIEASDASASVEVSTGFIQMQVIKAHWYIMPHSANEISITYSVIVDAKGNIPKWISKRMALKGIWATLSNIQQQLPNSKWQKIKQPYINEPSTQ